MASNYPGSLDSFDTIASDKKTSDAVGGRTHRQMHNDLGDAIEAVQTELGTDPSGGSATVKARFEVIEANDWVTAARIAANAVGASELADNAVDTAAVADSAITTAKVAAGAVTYDKLARQPGNLLSENQAKPTTTGGYTVTNATEGTAGVFTATGSSAVSAYLIDANAIPVTAGETYTALATAACTGGRTSRVRIRWIDVSNADVSNSFGEYIASGESRVTAVAPAGAVKARVYAVSSTAGAASDTVTLTAASFHRGVGGTFQLPGVPVPGQGAIKANGAVELPGGDYSPEGTVTANPGSTFLQTSGAATVTGMLSWRKATGTGNTGWVAGPEADTGWRNVSADVGADFSVSDKILIRRQGSRVTVQLRNVVRVTNSGNRVTPSTVYTLPTGFRQTSYVDFGACYVQTLLGCFSTGGDLNLLAVRSTGTWAANDALWGEGDFLTDDTWPTSLPGSAA